MIISNNFYVYTSGSKNIPNGCSGAINKNISDDKLSYILFKIKNEIYDIYRINFNELIFDEKIKNKMKWI